MHFDLLIITHIDIDHINGIIELLKEKKIDISFDDIWFNAYRHLPKTIEKFGIPEGETLSKILDDNNYSWNKK